MTIVSVLFIALLVFLFFILARRFLYYQNLISEAMKNKNYADGVVYSRKIGQWWTMAYLLEKIEKDFVKMDSVDALKSIEALIKVGQECRAKRILFNDARKRKDWQVLLNWYWKEVG